jgi:acyl-CoA synthetase (AMP-forming)/AMP-acid ligase II/acyl carrier protein
VEEKEIENCDCLRHVFCGGEVLSSELSEQFLDRLPVDLWNLYGPTEASIDATFWRCKRQANQTLPIGRPIANTEIYLLDAHLQPVPTAVPGEIHIGGSGLARGYLNRPALTAEKFIPNPFSDEPGARLYKTGDLARYLPDGNIEFLGRIDHQVKIRGFRIELGEISAVLGQHPWVSEAMVIAREDVPGDKRLVAYVVRGQSIAPAAGDLRSFLKAKLPDYMVPSSFVFLGALPLTPNGKIDHQALPAPDQRRPELEEGYVAPRTPVERMIAEIWAEVLKLDTVGVDDDFFELGGHSLVATQAISRIYQVSQVQLPVRSFFQAPTVAGLASLIETIRWNRQGQQGSIESKEEREQGDV